MTRNTYENDQLTHETDNAGKKILGVVIGAAALLAVGAAALYLVDVDQTQEARLPDVDVSVQQGQMPEFDVDVADVNLRSEDVNIEVPAMEVKTETKTIEVEVPVDMDVQTETKSLSIPTLEITKPEEDNPADNG